MGTDTGINFIDIALTELSFKLNKDFKPPKDGLPVDIGFKASHSFSPNKKNLSVELTIALFTKDKRRPFSMKVTVEGVFAGKDYEQLKKFAKVHAIAHLFPFVREIIGNTTMKANMPPLLLPPINLSAIQSEKN
ncbi:MAG: protein translocase subunit secB [Nitrospirae bacterium]|nr:MAG: protein translocase subunit secB [Nitrospirota bacterium]